ncbi:hypothetical protein BU24DRAFT_62108 [Aaosphaeria arxii CBS 175.79]|uniref:Uncharacterized protein n=1 Tax=Aaosphaeria arxii CBS 175.79 TaxID=1450172 RepID=A0A6A5XCB2_9PLEO|nr:uncharacterized protein BU24DRAFT_62108 [Aaosphaeria arxii CBS 175.79]KAF2010632.1 hypothetical protein BU24DRAFT_62108 [Aaosphaeria arxii CBS 175.79]
MTLPTTLYVYLHSTKHQLRVSLSRNIAHDPSPPLSSPVSHYSIILIAIILILSNSLVRQFVVPASCGCVLVITSRAPRASKS